MATWHDVYTHLGYLSVPSTENREYPPSPNVLDQLCSDLEAIDQNLRDAASDSVATQVGELKVDYNRHIQIDKVEGSRKIVALSLLTGIAAKFDKYTGRLPGTSTTPIAVKSIWC